MHSAFLSLSRLPALRTVGEEVSLGSNKYNKKAPDGCPL